MIDDPLLLNRGTRPRRGWTREDVRRREKARQNRASIRDTYRSVGWVCPNCGCRQITEYPADPWQDKGFVWATCRSGDRADDYIYCPLTSRIELDPERNPTAPAWEEWTDRRHAHEERLDAYQKRLDGYYAPLSAEGRPSSPPPRWDTPDPYYAHTNALDGVFQVRLLEARTVTPPLFAKLNLPSGHVHCTLVTSYIDDRGQRVGELVIDQPMRDDLRSELQLLLPVEQRAEAEAERYQILDTRPYGHEPFCWTSTLQVNDEEPSTEEAIVEDIETFISDTDTDTDNSGPVEVEVEDEEGEDAASALVEEDDPDLLDHEFFEPDAPPYHRAGVGLDLYLDAAEDAP